MAIGLALVGLALVALANLICAIGYGEVFLTRSAGRADLHSAPFRFLLSVAASLIVAPSGLLVGVLVIRSARDERRRLETLFARTRYEDPSHISRLNG